MAGATQSIIPTADVVYGLSHHLGKLGHLPLHDVCTPFTIVDGFRYRHMFIRQSPEFIGYEVFGHY